MNVKAGKLTKWVTDFGHHCVFSGEAFLCLKYQNNPDIINLISRTLLTLHIFLCG